MRRALVPSGVRRQSTNTREMATTRSALVVRRQYGGHAAPEPPKMPKGNLFGEARGVKREREDWELVWYVGMGGAFVLMGVALMTRPSTKPSAWAREELELRQEASSKQ
jgi:hypothetical protein